MPEKPIIYLSPVEKFDEFEALYLRVREKEGRIYTPEQIKKLPKIHNHKLTDEWRIRAHTLQRLIKYLSAKNNGLHVLEIGAGNGWLSANLAQKLTATVDALDVNEFELKQGAAVFGSVDNLNFYYGDIFQIDFSTKYDVILLASSVQYFPDIERLLNRLKSWLKPSGEIHILDTPFYTSDEVVEAKQRTEAYYSAMGVGELAKHYHHHTRNDLEKLDARLLYDPWVFINRLKIKFFLASPFPWVILK